MAADHTEKKSGRIGLICGIIAVVSAVLLFAIPETFAGLKALLNRLFIMSESRNTYVYFRYDVPESQPLFPALILLTVIVFCVVLYALIRRNPLFILCCAGLVAFGQIWFGLSLPGWANVLLFAFFGVLLLPSSRRLARFCLFACVTAATALMICMYNPGVDPTIEAMSESLRDRLSGAVMQAAGLADRSPLPPAGTRHVNSRALETGDLSSQTEREFRPVMIEQEEISQPDTLGQLRKAFPFVLAAAAAAYLGIALYRIASRRKRAMAARKRFVSENETEAVCAMFRHVAAYLTFAGCGVGNRPYRDWAEGLDGKMPSEYIRRYESCVPIFEEAAFSDHPLNAEQRGLVKELLDETESLIYDRADRKQRMQLRYTLCLHE